MKEFKRSLKNEYLPMLFTSMFVGVVIGLVVGLFNLALKFLSGLSVDIYTFVKENLLFIPLLFAVLVLFALLMNYIHKKNPTARGGGMPQTIAMCKGEAKYKWYQVLWGTISCSFMSFFCGLPVGAEGPSMFVGSATADGAHKTMKLRPYTHKYLVSAGASAGLAATFNAPLAGIVFTIEKVHRKFSPLLLFVVGIAVICSTITINLLSLLWGGQALFFDFPFLADIPFEFFGMLALLGVVVGFCAVGFQLLLVKSQKFLDKKTKQFPFWARLVSIFVLTGITGLFLTDAITGGHDLIEKIASLDFAIVTLLVLLVVKLFLITICYNSGATGGMFVPTLCIGALVGGICGHFMVMLGMPSDFYATIVCVSMMGFLSGTTHAPISALVLMLEISGFTGNLLSSGIVIIIAFAIALIIRRKSLFEEQVDRIVESTGQKEEGVSISQTIKIQEDSVLIGKRVSDIFLPKFVDISSIIRGRKTIVSDSETRIHAGDKIEFIYQKQNADEIEKFLDDVTR